MVRDWRMDCCHPTTVGLYSGRTAKLPLEAKAKNESTSGCERPCTMASAFYMLTINARKMLEESTVRASSCTFWESSVPTGQIA